MRFDNNNAHPILIIDVQEMNYEAGYHTRITGATMGKRYRSQRWIVQAMLSSSAFCWASTGGCKDHK